MFDLMPIIYLSRDYIGKISFVYLPINETNEFYLLYRDNILILEKITYSIYYSTCCCGTVTNKYIFIRQ